MACRIILMPGPSAAGYAQQQAIGFRGTYEQYAESARASAGSKVFMCGPRMGDTQICACGCLAGYLCDYPVGADKTCDRPLCDQHAAQGQAGDDLHYCPDHHRQWRDWLSDAGLESALLEHMARKG